MRLNRQCEVLAVIPLLAALSVPRLGFAKGVLQPRQTVHQLALAAFAHHVNQDAPPAPLGYPRRPDSPHVGLRPPFAAAPEGGRTAELGALGADRGEVCHPQGKGVPKKEAAVVRLARDDEAVLRRKGEEGTMGIHQREYHTIMVRKRDGRISRTGVARTKYQASTCSVLNVRHIAQLGGTGLTTVGNGG